MLNSIVVLIIFFLAHVLNSCTIFSHEKPAKNVLFIIADDLNTTLGCYGHPVVKTPNIDRLAQKGIRFNHAYCNYTVCNPSRSSFLTGVLPGKLNIYDNRTPLQSVPGEHVTLPDLFKQNGYHTVSIGKVFHGLNEFNDMKAWDEIYNFTTTETGRMGEGRNLTDGVLRWCRWLAAEGDDMDQEDGQIAQKAVEFIKSEHTQPFFLAVGFAKPHDPYVAPRKYFASYSPVNCTPPLIPEGWKAPHRYTLGGMEQVFEKFTDTERCEFLRAYYSATSFMDAQAGRIIDALEETGLIKNTLIIIFGDHGFHLGEHGWWNKVTLYERCHNAPLIIYDPDCKISGVASDALVEFIDFYPTLADICSLKNIPEYLDGRSFKEVIYKPSLPFRNYVSIILKRNDVTGRSVKTLDWRYTEWGDGDNATELYDERNDPMEYTNLSGVGEYDTIKNYLKKLMEE
jgi:arylsulfatase A-like enzyme